MNDPSRGGWRDIAERGTVFGIRALVWLGTVGGRGPARFVLRFVALYYVLVHGRVRRASRRALERIHGKATFGMVYAHVRHFAEASLDRFFFVSGRTAGLRVTRKGTEHLRRLSKEKRGAILLGAHVGSFEAMRMQAGSERLAINVVGFFRNARMINAALEALDPNVNTRVIDIGGSPVEFMLQIKERLQQGEMVAILGDRAGPEGKVAEADFFGEKAAFPTGAYVIAAALKCPIYLTFGLYRSPDGYELCCEPFADEVKLPRVGRDEAVRAYVQRYATRLEAYVRSAPDNWFNFYDFWKTP